MKVALIGASGFVGKHLLQELLDRKHSVIAIARHPDNLRDFAQAYPSQLTTAEADVNDVKVLSAALSGAEAVISAYNAGWTNPNLYEDFLKGAGAIQQAVKDAGIKRLIVIGGAGSLYTPEGIQLVDMPNFPKAFKPGATAARDYLTAISSEKDLDWTFLSPAIEMNQTTAGERKGHYRTGLEQPVFDENGRSVISVEDLSMAIVDELENPQNLKRRFTVGY